MGERGHGCVRLYVSVGISARTWVYSVTHATKKPEELVRFILLQTFNQISSAWNHSSHCLVVHRVQDRNNSISQFVGTNLNLITSPSPHHTHGCRWNHQEKRRQVTGILSGDPPQL